MLINVVGLFSFISVFFFSAFLFFSDSLIFSWLCLELSTLCLVPAFFMGSLYCSFSPLFNYLIVSGVSSGLIVLGLLFPDLLFFLMLGFIIKFGLFPFMGWVYSVCTESNWYVVYFFTIVVKSSFLIICFFVNDVNSFYFVTGLACVFTLLSLSGLFWLYTFSWYHCWCHIMLSSSCILLLMSLIISVDSLFWFYSSYFVWGTLCILFLYYLGTSFVFADVMSYVYFCFLFLSTPLSLSLLYKFVICFNVFSCSFAVLLFWVLYGISEQFFLFKYICSMYLPKKLSGVGELV